MDGGKPKTLFFKRSNFVTHLPVTFLYSPSHYWLAKQPDGVWRVGFTKFAVRMLGELVDQGFEKQAGDSVKPGDLLGWIEGFKAISDIYGVVEGIFRGPNPSLSEGLEAVHDAPYTTGWLYAAEGDPDANCLDVHAYETLLNRTIDRILAQQGAGEGTAE